MRKVKIKTESPPSRCEICHKTDCFDVGTLLCSRCKNLVLYKEQNFEINNFEHQKKENYVDRFLEKNSGWKRRSNEVNRKFAIAGGLVFFNTIYFIEILRLSEFSRLHNVVNNTICGLVFILLIEYIPLKIFSKKDSLFCQGGLIGVYLTLAIIVSIISLFAMLIIYYYFFGQRNTL